MLRPVPDRPAETPAVRDLRGRLRAARRRITAAAATRGLLVTLAVVGAAVALAVGVEAALWMGVGLRTLLAASLAALVAGLVGALVGVPLLRGAGWLPGLGERDVVRRAGDDFAGVDTRLTALLDLADGRTSGSDRMRTAALDSLAEEVRDVPFERVRAWGPARQALPYAGAAVVALAVLFVAAPGTMAGAAFRLLEPQTFFAPPAPFALRVLPGDVDVARGADVEVRVATVGRVQPLAATIEVGRIGERATDETRLRSTGVGRFAHTIESVSAPVRYRVVADGVASQWFTVRIAERPVVQGVRLTVTPPAYTGRPGVVLPEGVGDASGLPGTSVRVQVGVGGVRAAEGWLDVRYADGTRERVALRIGSDAALGRLVLRRAATYSVRLESAGGVANADPATYALGVVSDSPPTITLLNGGEGDLAGVLRRMRFGMSDDVGIAGGALVWRVAAAPGRRASPVRRVALPIRGRTPEQTVDLLWRMAGVRPGDVVEFYGEVREVGPGRRARTALVRLRMPSREERQETFASRRDSASSTLDQMRRRAERQGAQTDRLREQLRARPEADWEARRQVEQLRAAQAEQQAQARQLQQQMRELAEQLRGSDQVTPEMQQRFEQMERVMEDLASPELQEALQKLQEAMEQLNLEQMLRQADEVDQAQQTFEQRLERAKALLERLEAAVEMEEAARDADALAEREEQLARDAERLLERQNGERQQDRERQDGDSPNSPPQRSPEARSPEAERRRMTAEQRDAAEDAEALDEALQELQERLEDIPNAPDEAVEEMREQTTPEGGLPQQMQQNADQMQQGQMQPAQQGQQEMARQLRRMAQQMRQQSAQMQGQQARVDAAALRRALEDVLTLSRRQEALANEAAAAPDGNPALVPLARRQRDLGDGLRAVSDTLRRVSRSVPALTAAVQTRAQNGQREMDLALARLAERDAAPASSHGRTAMGHLNELALLLSEALDQQQKQQGGSGGQGSPQQQMQQMGGQQQRLNQQIQEMLGRTAGQRLSPGEGTRLRQMAEQQESLRRSLQNLIEQNGGTLGAGAQSALQRLQEQMARAAAELRRGRLNDALVPRQQQIYERMLQAEQAVNERGQEERREGETARPAPAAPPPPPLPPVDRAIDRTRAELLRLDASGYAPGVEALIRRYFERIGGR